MEAVKEFGKYKLIKEIGKGGYATVHLAQDKLTSRKVAIKTLSNYSESSVERFKNEIRLHASLTHPNIVPVYETGTLMDIPYIVMEHISGDSLQKILSESYFTIDKTCSIIKQCANALDYIHQQKITHCDVNPSNILINSDNTPYLIDFGLAFDSTQSKEGLKLAGTTHFLSPEQARSNYNEVDATTDQYALGATLYYMLTNTYPVTGKSDTDIIMKIANSFPVEMDPLFDSDAPYELQYICLKTLEKSKNNRYKSCEDFKQDIDRFLNGEATIAEFPQISWQVFAKKYWHILAPVALTALTLTGILGFKLYSSYTSRALTQQLQEEIATQEQTINTLQKQNTLLSFNNELAAFKIHLDQYKIPYAYNNPTELHKFLDYGSTINLSNTEKEILLVQSYYIYYRDSANNYQQQTNYKKKCLNHCYPVEKYSTYPQMLLTIYDIGQEFNITELSQQALELLSKHDNKYEIYLQAFHKQLTDAKLLQSYCQRDLKDYIAFTLLGDYFFEQKQYFDSLSAYQNASSINPYLLTPLRKQVPTFLQVYLNSQERDLDDFYNCIRSLNTINTLASKEYLHTENIIIFFETLKLLDQVYSSGISLFCSSLHEKLSTYNYTNMPPSKQTPLVLARAYMALQINDPQQTPISLQLLETLAFDTAYKELYKHVYTRSLKTFQDNPPMYAKYNKLLQELTNK